MASFEADTSSLQRFAKKIIRSAPKEVKDELRKAVRAAGQLVADDAKLRAPKRKGEDKSRIAKTIRVGASGATATIRAGNANTPEAALLEGDGTPGTFRHPLFGDKDHAWYEQARQPYLHPALEAKRSDAEDLLAAAAQTAVEKVVKE